MALKGNRTINSQDMRVDIYVDEVAERGGFLSYSTAGSGFALDQASNLGTYAANPSGKVVIGCLLEDIVNVDLTKYKLNQHKSEIQKGGKASIAGRGSVQTNMYVGSPSLGTAYLWNSGLLTSVVSSTGGVVATPLVGRFEGTPDEDGFVKVRFTTP